MRMYWSGYVCVGIDINVCGNTLGKFRGENLFCVSGGAMPDVYGIN